MYSQSVRASTKASPFCSVHFINFSSQNGQKCTLLIRPTSKHLSMKMPRYSACAYRPSMKCRPTGFVPKSTAAYGFTNRQFLIVQLSPSPRTVQGYGLGFSLDCCG